MRGRPGRYTVQPPMSLTRPDVMRGPRFTSTGPRAGNPRPLASLVSRLGPPFCGRVQSLCHGCEGSAVQICPSRPINNIRGSVQVFWRKTSLALEDLCCPDFSNSAESARC
jgi:hypothetical protein